VAQRGQEGKLYPELTMEQIKFVVETLIEKNLKAVILSGGGEPLVYPQIKELIEYLYVRNLDIGLITNGVLLKEKLDRKTLEKLSWVRVSINSLDQVENIEMPGFSKGTTFGLSYIWNPLSEKTFIKVKEFVKKYNPEYVRLLPDCNLSDEKLEEEHQKLHKLAEELGKPYFHQYKTHRQPKECHLGRVHPVLYTDGMIYPCDSLVLNSPLNDRKFHQEYALCKWDDIKKFRDSIIEGSLIDTTKCPNCVFARQNDLLSEIIYGDKEGVKHLNFI
jgi:MoaA/NifB/PqqE/SkfB family radical SAM enzyme